MTAILKAAGSLRYQAVVFKWIGNRCDQFRSPEWEVNLPSPLGRRAGMRACRQHRLERVREMISRAKSSLAMSLGELVSGMQALTQPSPKGRGRKSNRPHHPGS